MPSSDQTPPEALEAPEAPYRRANPAQGLGTRPSKFDEHGPPSPSTARVELGALLGVAASKITASSPSRSPRVRSAEHSADFTDVDLGKPAAATGVVPTESSATGKGSLLGRVGVMDPALRKLIGSAVAEAIGLGIICFFGCMGTLNGPLGSLLPHMQVAITFGLIVMVAIACFAHVSGAHFNPAVTLLALIMKLLDLKTAATYLVAQCIGGTLGYGLLKVVTPTSLLYWGRVAASDAANATLAVAGPCCTVPHAQLSAAQAVLAELAGTAALLMLCCSVWDPRNAANTDGIPIKFGLLIAGVAMCLGPYTGASLNPARSLGPAIWEGTWTLHWVYWVGPLSAAVLLGYGWPLLFSPIPERPAKDNADVPLTLVSGDGKRHSRLAEDDKTGY